MKTVTIKIGTDVHRLVKATEKEGAGSCVNVCSLNGLCFRTLGLEGSPLCKELIREISEYPKDDFPFGAHFVLKTKQRSE